MSRETTFTREVDDIYNPDPDAMIEVTVRVSYSLAPAERDVGIFSSYLDEWTVEETDSDLFDVDQAEWWLLNTMEGRREIDDITQEARDEECDYEDYDRED